MCVLLGYCAKLGPCHGRTLICVAIVDNTEGRGCLLDLQAALISLDSLEAALVRLDLHPHFLNSAFEKEGVRNDLEELFAKRPRAYFWGKTRLGKASGLQSFV